MPKSERFEMRLSVEELAQIDDLRRKEVDVPPRAEMIRRLIARAERRTESRKSHR